MENNVRIHSKEERDKYKELYDYLGIAQGTDVFYKDAHPKLEGRNGSCWEFIYKPNIRFYTSAVDTYGKIDQCWIDCCNVGFRPAFSFSKIEDITTNGGSCDQVKGKNIWKITGRYVPQNVPSEEEQKKLKEKIDNGTLKVMKKKHYPKFSKLVNKAILSNNYDENIEDDIEWLDEYVDEETGNRYAVRIDGDSYEFEECKSMIAYAIQNEDGTYEAVYSECYFGGLPFNFINEITDFEHTFLGEMCNGPLKNFFDLTVPEQEPLKTADLINCWLKGLRTLQNMQDQYLQLMESALQGADIKKEADIFKDKYGVSIRGLQRMDGKHQEMDGERDE